MSLSSKICAGLLCCLALACNNTEKKPAPEAPVMQLAIEEDQFPDLQTITENHKILTIRVAGNLDKVSTATKQRVASMSKTFDAAFEEYKSALVHRNSLRDALKTFQETTLNNPASSSDAAQTEKDRFNEIVLASGTVEQAQEKYEIVAREFAKLIEQVKLERN